MDRAIVRLCAAECDLISALDLELDALRDSSRWRDVSFTAHTTAFVVLIVAWGTTSSNTRLLGFGLLFLATVATALLYRSERRLYAATTRVRQAYRGDGSLHSTALMELADDVGVNVKGDLQ